jgi:hypothetical protein
MDGCPYGRQSEMTKYLCIQRVDVADRISVSLGVVSAPHWAAHGPDHVSVMHFAGTDFPWTVLFPPSPPPSVDRSLFQGTSKEYTSVGTPRSSIVGGCGMVRRVMCHFAFTPHQPSSSVVASGNFVWSRAPSTTLIASPS